MLNTNDTDDQIYNNEILFELLMETILKLMIFAVLLCYSSSSERMGLSFIGPHNDQLPFGLIAQLVEHYTSITEVRVQVSSRPEFFSKTAKIITKKKNMILYRTLLLWKFDP